jgi:hypothetical protein
LRNLLQVGRKAGDSSWPKLISQLEHQCNHFSKGGYLLASKVRHLFCEFIGVELTETEGAEAEFKQLREAYLPETLLAYITTLQFGGNALTRDFLMECMEISALVAEDGSDLLDIFMTTGRMGELVEVLALASKALLLITSEKQSQGSRSKKMRVKGWTQELWSVKP